MLDVVVQMIQMMQQVAAEVNTVLIASQLANGVHTNLDVNCTDCLCELELLAVQVDPHWRRNHTADWQSLPYCDSPTSTAAAQPPSSPNVNPFIELANNLIDVLGKLKLTRCIAETQL